MRMSNDPKWSYWMLAATAAALLAITNGGRLSLGLFVSPLNTSTGLGITTISLVAWRSCRGGRFSPWPARSPTVMVPGVPWRRVSSAWRWGRP